MLAVDLGQSRLERRDFSFHGVPRGFSGAEAVPSEWRREAPLERGLMQARRLWELAVARARESTRARCRSL
jgi:hypothetical protein